MTDCSGARVGNGESGRRARADSVTGALPAPPCCLHIVGNSAFPSLRIIDEIHITCNQPFHMNSSGHSKCRASASLVRNLLVLPQ